MGRWRGGLGQRRRGARLLVVEGDPGLRSTLYAILAERYEVTLAADAGAGLAAARARVPDLVLADLGVPGLEGLDLVRALRRSRASSATAIVLMSSSVARATCVAGLVAGADDLLVKPFGREDLVACVEAHLALARVERPVPARRQACLAEPTCLLRGGHGSRVSRRPR